MPNNETGAVCLREVPLHPVADREEDGGNAQGTGARVGMLKTQGHAMQIGQPTDIGRQRVALICNELCRVRQRTDPYERMEISGDFFPLIGSIRQWYRDNTRVNAVLSSLNKLAGYPDDVDGTAWFSVFVLVEPMSRRRYEPTMQASIRQAQEHGTPWTLQVLAHWLYSSSNSLPLATMRRNMVETLVPLWHQGKHRDDIAPILAVAVAMYDVDPHCPGRRADWEILFPLLPDIQASQTHLSDAECVLAGGLIDAAAILDGPGNPEAHGCVNRVKARLGPETARVRAGVAKRRQWGSSVQDPMLDCGESKNYRAAERKFNEVRHERARMFWKDVPRYPYIPFSATN